MTSASFCNECGGQLMTEIIEVRTREKPAEASIVSMSRCIICGKTLDFAE